MKKTLLSTTALVLFLGFPTLALSQTETSASDETRTQQAAAVPGFLAMPGQSDVFATDLIGHDVYARRSSADMTRTDDKANENADRTQGKANKNANENADRTQGKAARNAAGTHGKATMNRADLDGMEKIGQINEIVLSNDGQVRALVIGVGGFLGLGEQDVAVTMDQVTFASDPDDRSETYVVVNIGKDQLKDSPAYDRTSMTTDDDARNDEARADRSDDETRADRSDDEARADRSTLAAPEIERDGYDRVEATEVSTEILMGKSVYDVNDNDVGTVTDMILDDAGAITNVIIDFGGFLGLGKSQVSMDFDELTIMSNEGRSDVRVYVDATKEQIQGRPQYHAKN